MHTKTYSVRVKDKHREALKALAFGVNQVWNEANSYTANHTDIDASTGRVCWPSAFDLQKRLRCIRVDRGLGIGSTTFQEVISAHAKARNQLKRTKLRWRISSGPKRSLGWVPFKSRAVKSVDGGIAFGGVIYKIWDSYNLDKATLRSGSFSEDARGRWYLNICVQIPLKFSRQRSAIGIDLGLKDTAICSDGDRLEAKRFYRSAEADLAKLQRAKKKRQVKTLYAKIKNRRKDTIHKFTTKLVRKHSKIAVGDVSSTKLVKTKMAKSVLDSGWGMLRNQLKYKAIGQSIECVVVNEAYTTQRCSCCQDIPDSSPKGRAALGIREWTCSTCGAQHDRDINAARNILAVGCGSPVEGIPAL